LLQSLDLAFENPFDEVKCHIHQNFNDGSDNIFHLNEGSSREFTLEPIKEEKVEECDILAAGWMSGSFAFELRHLLRIEFEIVGFGIIHMEHGA
jgi:hypothetical protein